jgi:hypothetical protein
MTFTLSVPDCQHHMSHALQTARPRAMRPLTGPPLLAPANLSWWVQQPAHHLYHAIPLAPFRRLPPTLPCSWEPHAEAIFVHLSAPLGQP